MDTKTAVLFAAFASPAPDFSAFDSPPAAVASQPDPRGVWSPVWDGYQWQPRWIREGGVVVQTVPFAVSPGSTPTTNVTGVVVPSTSSNGFYRLDSTSTGAAPVATSGSTNCPPGLP